MADDVSFERLSLDATTLTQREVWPEALVAWQAVAASYPHKSDGYRGAATALEQLHRLDDADKLLGDGMTKVPGDVELAAHRAWLATGMDSDIRATERWDAVLARFPEEPVGYVGLATLLQTRNRVRLADIVLMGAAIKFPHSQQVAVDFARVAASSGRAEDALTRWLAVLEQFPELSAAYFGAAASYRALRRMAEAEAMIRRARERFPNDPGVACDLAALSKDQGDWDEALRRWDAISQKYGGDKDVMRQVSRGIGEVELARYQERLAKASASAGASQQTTKG